MIVLQFETLVEFEQAEGRILHSLGYICNSGLVVFALALLLLGLWFGLCHLLSFLLLPLLPSHCHLERTLQLCLGWGGYTDLSSEFQDSFATLLYGFNPGAVKIGEVLLF